MAEPSIERCPLCGGWSGYYWQAAFRGAWGEEPKRLAVGENQGTSYTWKNARCLDCGRRVPIENAASRATPQPKAESLASALRCDGECGFERTGLGWTCRDGEACGRYVHPGDQGFDALERHHREMTKATPQPEVPETLWGYKPGDEVLWCDRLCKVVSLVMGRSERGPTAAIYVEAVPKTPSFAAFCVYDPAKLRPAPRAEGAGDA